jgi:hypothetical protein
MDDAMLALRRHIGPLRAGRGDDGLVVMDDEIEWEDEDVDVLDGEEEPHDE